MGGGVVEDAQRLPPGPVPRGGGQGPAHQGLLQREEPDGLRGGGVQSAQPGEGPPQPDQAPVIVHQGVVGLRPLPVQPVQGGRGAVAVAHPFFGPGKLLPRLQKGHPQAGEVDARRQTVLGQGHRVRRRKLRPLVPHHQQLVPQGEVVVGGDVADDLARGVGRQGIRAAPGRHSAPHIPEGAGLALDIPRLPCVEAAALDGVPGVVAEDADPVREHGEVVLDRLVAAQAAGPALPGLAVHQDLLPAGQAVQGGPHGVDGLHIVQPHQVEAEAVDVILPGPVEDGVDQIAAGHGPLAGELVAAAAAVGEAAVLVLAEEVVGSGVVEDIFVPVGVVVHHIHHHPDVRCVEGGDHLLALPDPHLSPGGVGGVASLRHVEVHRIVAPVVLPHQGAPLVHAAEVKEGHQLHIADPQPLEVGQAGGVGAVRVEGGALLGESQVFAPPGRAHPAGRILGKVPDADLPHHPAGRRDGGALVPAPAGGIGAGEVRDHAAQAVGPRRHGIGVPGLPGCAPHPHHIGVVPAVLVPGEVDLPHALGLAAHGQGADGCASLPLAEQVHRHLLGRGGPQPQPGAPEAVLGPQGAGIGGFPGKFFAVVQGLPPCRRFTLVHAVSVHPSDKFKLLL